MLWSAIAACVLAVVLACAYATDVIAERERSLRAWLDAGRFDRTYQHNRATRLARSSEGARPDLRVVRGGRHQVGARERAGRR